MLDNELEIIKVLGNNSALLLAVWLLWKQYTGSIDRMFQREKEFYQSILKELQDIKTELKNLEKK